MAAIAFGQAKPGTVFTLKEDDVEKDFLVIKHGYPDSGNGKTLVLRKDTLDEMQFSSPFGSAPANYVDGQMDVFFSTTYFQSLDVEFSSLIENVSIPYTPQYSDPVSLLSRKVFALSATEFNLNTPEKYNTEGEPIPYFSENATRIANYDGEAVFYWTRSVSTNITNGAVVINRFGDFVQGYTHNSMHVRPAFTLISSGLYITDSGKLVTNTPPVITGTDGDLGTFGETSPTYAYTVTDPQGGTVSVTEALDGETLRTYTVTLGQQNTLTIPAATYLTTLNGTHTLTITATDSVGAQTVRTETFTKNVTSCAFTQTTAFTVDDMPTRCVVNIQGAFPEGSVLTVQICNNGNDASPTWETITQQALLGQKYFFQNETKTAAEWGVKVQASLSRGTAEGDCYISSIGGVFQ